MKQESLPSNYKAPVKMKIGTNTLENVNIMFSFKGFVPILIGDGKNPRIWLNIPSNKEGTEWYPLIKDNFSTNPKVTVIETKNSVKVTTPDGVVVECIKASDGTIDVKKLNLKPFGLNVKANSEMLTVMNQTFTSNGFKNVGTMFGIGAA